MPLRTPFPSSVMRERNPRMTDTGGIETMPLAGLGQ
jgi:hypothetical protein